MFMNIMQYLTFSIKLYAFYEIIKAASFDIFFFVIIFMIVMMTYSLIGIMIFGSTDPKFSSIGESIMTLFLLLIGTYTPSDIITENLATMHIYGVTYILINIILTNIVVAIIGTHYFEFYVEQGENHNNMLKIILRYIIEDWKTKKFTNSDSWYQKLVNKIFSEINHWLTVVVDEEHIGDTGKKPHFHKLEGNDLAVPFGFFDMVDKMEGDKTKGMYLNSNMKKMHFWVTLIDHAISQKVREGYFGRLYNDDSLIEDPKDRFHQNHDIDPNFDDKYLYFAMSTQPNREIIWKKANLGTKFVYWQ